MAHRPEVFRPVDVAGSLRVETPGGQSLNLVAEKQTLRIDAPRWADAKRALPRSFRGRRRALRYFANRLAIHGLTFTVESAGKPLLRLGYETSPSWLARVLGLAPAYIPVAAIAWLFRR